MSALRKTILSPSSMSSRRSLSCGSRSWRFSYLMPFRKVVNVASFLTATVIDFCSSLRSSVLAATGSFTSIPFCSMGVITMKMMSRTIMMSAMGVTLMSAMAPPLDFADCH